MDFNDSLVGLVGLSTAILGLRLSQSKPAPRGWLAVLAVLIAVLAVGSWLLPGYVGYVALAAWGCLVLLPTLGQRVAIRWANAGRPRMARHLARLVTLAHPADGWSDTREFVETLVALQQGDAEQANRLLAGLQTRDTQFGRSAVALAIRQSGEWERFLRDIERSGLKRLILADGNMLDVYLQALGETGQISAMLAEYGRRPGLHSHATAQLRIAALTGDVETTRRLLNGGLSEWPADVRRFWIATARQARGDDATLDDFHELSRSHNLLVSNLSRRRTEQPLAVVRPADLSADDQSLLDRLHHDVRHDARYAVLTRKSSGWPWVTLLLTLAMIANFLREIPGGVENYGNLVDKGAIVIADFPDDWPESRYDEWWRPFSAAFVHFGWAHFLMNIVALLYLGRQLEQSWGHTGMLLCFFVAVFVSMAVTPRFLPTEEHDLQLLAGASGGIMGLLGGLLGHLIAGWLRHRTPEVQRQMLLLLMLVVLQTTFDFLHPYVSYHAHLLGLVTGLTIGFLWGAAAQTETA
jgi:rhomboid protease GluP